MRSTGVQRSCIASSQSNAWTEALVETLEDKIYRAQYILVSKKEVKRYLAEPERAVLDG